MTERQLKLIWNISDSPIICFDGDDAGKKASKRLIDIAIPDLRPGKTIRFINLIDGIDPDDFIKKNSSPTTISSKRTAIAYCGIRA